MPAKKAARSKKTAVKAAARKSPPPRKAAKPAGRKSRPTPARAKAAAKPVKTKPRAVAAVNAGKAAGVAVAREAVVVKPKPAAPVGVVAEARTTFAALHPKARRINADDDEDGTGAHNLLLGPRNVRPYRERKGEMYMGRDQLDHFRGILNSWKRDLMEEVDRTMTHMKDEAANPPDPNDRATLESEFALELRTRDRERKLIRKIDEALSRIEDGSYGYCNETGEPIGVKRLEARPVATLCLEAQERRERREKQYGDRDDWYR